jgi:hypothetical protein
MQTKLHPRPDLLLLLSLLLAILLTPELDRDGCRRLVLAGVTFIPSSYPPSGCRRSNCGCGHRFC